jgi:hypothetical protein
MAKITGATNHTGKGSEQELLPHRRALASLVKGDPSRRTMNDYAKATPIGAGGLDPTSIMAMLHPSGKLNRFP